jgi:ribosome-binding protein aMBF1 (putative translation factor)
MREQSTFAERLEQAMENKGMSQADLARATGAKPMDINHCVRGRRTPHLRNLASLAMALRPVSLNWLVTGEFK